MRELVRLEYKGEDNCPNRWKEMSLEQTRRGRDGPLFSLPSQHPKFGRSGGPKKLEFEASRLAEVTRLISGSLSELERKRV